MDYSDFSNKDEKEENDGENSAKRNIDKNNYDFDKIKTFSQLKNKVLEIKREQEKTKIDVGENTDKIEYIGMKALSHGLIKGYIDQADRKLYVNWIQPKYLGKEKIGVMKERMLLNSDALQL